MNYFIFLLVLTILISQDILLFNEETLILLSFIGFCVLFIENLGLTVNTYFKNQSKKIQREIDISYISVLDISSQVNAWNSKKKQLVIYFRDTKKYYNRFNCNILTKLVDLQLAKKQVIFHNKLRFTHELEQQLIKLVILLIATKVKKLVKTNLFYKNIAKLPKFLCIHKIILREYFSMIK